MDLMPAPVKEKSLWRNGSFFRLFVAHAISLVGNSFTAVALGLLAHELVGAAVSEVVGVTLTIRIIVVVFISPFSGQLADFFSVRATLLAADLFRALIVLGFLFVDALWQIYVLAFSLNFASSIFTPVYKAVIPGVVPEKLYPKALSFGAVAYDLANIAGPALAALLIATFGFRGNFVANALAFVASAVLIFGLPYFRAEKAKKKGKQKQETALLFGLRAMTGRKKLRAALVYALKVSVISGFVLVATIDYIKNELQLPDIYFAWITLAYGTGSVTGALAYGQLTGAFRRQAVFLASPLLIVVLFVAALDQGFVPLAVAWFAAGAAQVCLGIRGNELLAASSVGDERPHIYAAHFSLSHVGWGVTYPLAGFLTSSLGFPAAALIFALLLLAVSLTGLFFRAGT
ncbi:MAG: MFS transporter [Opitutales bacterium]